jgi:hypothetical protein
MGRNGQQLLFIGNHTPSRRVNRTIIRHDRYTDAHLGYSHPLSADLRDCDYGSMVQRYILSMASTVLPHMPSSARVSGSGFDCWVLFCQQGA